MQDLSFWKLPFHRYVNERTQLSKSKWWLKKKTTKLFSKRPGRICDSQGWRELGGVWEVSFFFSILHQHYHCTSRGMTHCGDSCLGVGRMGTFCEIYGRILIYSDLTFTTKKVTPSPTQSPLLGQPGSDGTSAESQQGQQHKAGQFWRKSKIIKSKTHLHS